MMRLIVALVAAIFLVGIALKMLKFAVVLALCSGIYLIAHENLGAKQFK